MITAVAGSPTIENFGEKTLKKLWSAKRDDTWYCAMCSLDDVPHVFGRMTELAASDAGTKAEIADTDRLVLEFVSKVVLAFSHGADEDTDAFIWCKALDIVFNTDNFCLEAQRDFPALRRKVVCYRILNDLQELFLRVGGSYG